MKLIITNLRFCYTSLAYQTSLIEPWFVFWRDVVEPIWPSNDHDIRGHIRSVTWYRRISGQYSSDTVYKCLIGNIGTVSLYISCWRQSTNLSNIYLHTISYGISLFLKLNVSMATMCFVFFSHQVLATLVCWSCSTWIFTTLWFWDGLCFTCSPPSNQGFLGHIVEMNGTPQTAWFTAREAKRVSW